MKRLAAVAVLAACMSVSLVAVATAHTVKYDSEVTLHVKKNGQEEDTFEGRVTSDKARCMGPERSALIKNGPDSVVAVADTDADGHYVTGTGEDIPAGTYHAKVTRDYLRSSAKHTHVCRGARSENRMVAAPPG
jgi:hypothetical protein